MKPRLLRLLFCASLALFLQQALVATCLNSRSEGVANRRLKVRMSHPYQSSGFQRKSVLEPVLAAEPEPVSPSNKHSHTAASDAGHGQLVNWQGFSEDLFERARREKKLVILDLEAVWCHWCHVMERKTYSNPEIAGLLNEHFICVKVDQDSRPDLSNRYEDYGWPATIIFNSRGEELSKRSGFIEPDEMLRLLNSLLKNPVPEEDYSKKEIKYSSQASLSKALFGELLGNHRKFYDEKSGGWKTLHKFLDADSVELALTLASEGDKKEAQRARQTLIQQLNLHDPVWGGVYQYSTGGDWKHPHFEKIMSVQADNLRIYSLAYLYFKDPRFLQAAENTEKYLRNFLMSPDGAFYTSQDADLKQGEHSAEYFKLDDASRRKLGIPIIDKHIYARENGWAISGLSALYMASGNPRYLAEAVKAAAWVMKNRSLPNGGYSHDFKDAAGPYLGDTLYMGRAFLSLYQASAERKYLKHAMDCADFIDKNFKNSPGKAGYLTAQSAKSGFAEPSCLLDENIALSRFANLLSFYSGRAEYKKMAENCMRYLSTAEIAHERKILVAGILLADRESASAPAHITIVGSKSDPQARVLFMAANRYPLSYKRVEWFDAKEGKMPNPDTEYPEMPKAAAFACAKQRCSLPAYTPEAIAPLVEKTLAAK